MSGIIAEIQEAIAGYRALQLTSYLDLSSAVVLVYYHLTTLNKEIELIWKRKWSFSKVLFLVLRYYTIASIIYQLKNLLGSTSSYSECRAWIRWQAFDSCFVFFLTEIILQMRIYALYDRSKKILITMAIVFVLSLATSVGLLIADLRISGYIFFALKPSNLCSIDNWRPSWVYILSFIISDAFLLALALFRGYQSLRDYKYRRQGTPRIIELLVHDSIYYFLVILVVYLTYMLVWITDNMLFDMLSGYSITAPTVMCSHLILHMQEKLGIREQYTEWDSEYTTTEFSRGF